MSFPPASAAARGYEDRGGRRRDDRDRRGGGPRDGWQYGQQARGGVQHNPYEIRMPWFLDYVAHTDDPEDNSILVVDRRDNRLVSPFQAWLVSEIMANSASSINVLTERDQVMPPSGGFHVALFANYTLDGIKAVLAVVIECDTGHTCGQWDSHTADALSHPAFQPFSWPMLREESASYVDIKVYNGNEVLFHWVLRGYRADTDLTVQQQMVDEFFVREARKGNPRLSVVIAVFVGWRVSVLSYESGGRTYSIGPRGSVVAGDSARSRFELRVTARDTDDAKGNDADRLEFRYRDAHNRMDLKCSRTSVPGTWLTVSHISGPTLVDTIRSVRAQQARVEGPEHTEQFAQLAAVHQGWWEHSVARSEADVGNMVVFVGELEEGNFHLQARAKLFRRAPEIVDQAALATMTHEPALARLAPQGPPVLTMEAWGAEQPRQALEAQEPGDALVAAGRRAGQELATRAFSGVQERGMHGHVEDPERDQARMDRRFARSTAGLTPQVFVEEMARRSYNRTTATIEEVGSSPRSAAVVAPAPATTAAPFQSSPAAQVIGAQPEETLTTPRSMPHSLGPAGHSSATTEDV